MGDTIHERVERISLTHPPSLTRSFPASGWPRSYLSDQGSGLEIWAFGAIRELSLGPGQALSASREFLRETLLDRRPNHEFGALRTGLPFLIAGHAFSASGHGDEWKSWGRGRIWLPRHMIVRSPEFSSPEALWISRSHEEDPQNLDLLRDSAVSPLAIALRPEESESAWNSRVRAALAAAPRIEKLVLARAETARLEDSQGLVDVLAAMNSTAAQASRFQIALGPEQAFFGDSPETLLRLAGRKLTTHALAGTATTDATNWSEKERREQAIVTRDIEARLEPLVSQLRLSKPKNLRYGKLTHLETRITGAVHDDVDILELLETLHPTPALAGFPREAAMPWLANNEALDRGWYGGPVGWIDVRGGGVFKVAIRSALLHANTLRFFAGAGIVSGSDPTREWEETRRKLESAAQGMGFENRGELIHGNG